MQFIYRCYTIHLLSINILVFTFLNDFRINFLPAFVKLIRRWGSCHIGIGRRYGLSSRWYDYMIVRSLAICVGYKRRRCRSWFACLSGRRAHRLLDVLLISYQNCNAIRKFGWTHQSFLNDNKGKRCGDVTRCGRRYDNQADQNYEDEEHNDANCNAERVDLSK